MRRGRGVRGAADGKVPESRSLIVVHVGFATPFIEAMVETNAKTHRVRRRMRRV
jgi:hypothetical protein